MDVLDAFSAVIIGIILVVFGLCFIAGIMLLRWAFGIEKIIALLKQIEFNTNSKTTAIMDAEKNQALHEIKILAAKIEENTSKEKYHD